MSGGGTSRRAVLGAAVALPLIGAPEAAVAARPLHHAAHGPPPRSGAEWEAALAAYAAAAGEVGAFERASAGRPYEEQAALEDAYGALGDAMYDALRRLLKAPAPDVAALAVKLELVVRHEVGSLEGGEACMEALLGDAVRLAG